MSLLAYARKHVCYSLLFCIFFTSYIIHLIFLVILDGKKQTNAKAPKEDAEKKKQEIEKRLQDVSGQLAPPSSSGGSKKTPKKGMSHNCRQLMSNAH